jgi:hypothetical protein
LFDQVSVQDRPSLFQALVSRINRRECYRDKSGEILRAGQWRQCSSELPLVAEFAVRRGDKAIFFGALRKPALSPGLTLLLVQLEEMIALNFTLFTDEEYIELSDAVESIRVEVSKLPKQAPSGSSADTNTYHHVRREIPTLCESLIEGSRKARFLYLKGALSQGMNLEINQDKGAVQTFLQKLGFDSPLIQTLDEVEKLYRASATAFDLKNSLGLLRSFLEQLHLKAAAAQCKSGSSPPLKWGGALTSLRESGVLTKQEERFVAELYTLISDTGVHPLIAEPEYARLMRNMSIEYGLLLLTKLDKLGFKQQN